MDGEAWIEFENGSRIRLSGRLKDPEVMRGADDGEGDYLRRGPREVSCEIMMRLPFEDMLLQMREWPTEFDYDEREPDGSVLLDG